MNQICRICLKEKQNTLDIFKPTTSVMISTKIMCLTKLQIYPDDGLPNIICKSCNRRLQNCIQFVKLCKNSDAELKKTLISDRDIETKKYAEALTPCTDDESNKASENPFINDDDHEGTSSIKSEYLDLNSTDNDEEDITKTNHIDLDRSPSEETLTLSENISFVNCVNSEKKTRKNQCFECGKILSSRHRLISHMACHLDIKPHLCKYCDKRFSLLENLTIHLRTHTGEKPYSCPICTESFAHYSSLIVHKRKHTGQRPYKCVICPRSFYTLGHLQYHTRLHTGEKNYECNKCSRTFITRGALKQHVITHSGEKSHVCSICGLRFTRSSNLKRHMQGSHKGASKETFKDTDRFDLGKRKGERRSRNEIID